MKQKKLYLFLAMTAFFSLAQLPGCAEPDSASSEETANSAVSDIRKWATIKKADGPEGRPLPLTGSWVKKAMFGPQKMVEMIKQGHHVMPTIGRGPGFLATYAYILENEGFKKKKLPDYMKRIEPVLKFCRKHDLPISAGGGNWAHSVVGLERQYERAPEKNRKTFSPRESPRLLVRKDGELTNGSRKNGASPFAPDERWIEYARWWMNNPPMQRIRELYPDPPMVVWLNNNEKGEIDVKHLERSVRFREKYGEDVKKEKKKRILRKAYDHKYKVLFNTARETLSEPAWKENIRFVAYNAWPRSVEGRTSARNHPGEWERYDGAKPEFYLNDWQIYRGKTDYNYWSPQTEALRIQYSQDAIFSARPQYYFSSIAWDGGTPGKRRSAVNSMAKGMYGSGAVQRWDFKRYEGMLQFGLWAMRPRVFREFRYPVTHNNAYDWSAFMTVVQAVDRPWNNETLKEFWKFGDLVGSKDFFPEHPKGRDPLLSYSRVRTLLPVDVNPPRDKWPRMWRLKAGKRDPVKLRVLALALKLGEKPERRWLIYAHAPLDPVGDATVTLPGDRKVNVGAVSRAGSFYVYKEADHSVRTLFHTGPPAIRVDAGKRFVSPGESVRVNTEMTVSPGSAYTSFEWSTGDGNPHTSKQLKDRTLTLREPGSHMIRVTGTTEEGRTVTGETPVFVGEKPGKKVVYDLELSDATAWSGPWEGTGKNQSELLNYRIIPNPGRAPGMVLHGGTFVDDPEQGRVLELSGDPEGTWGVRSKLTCHHGWPNLTISMRFKAKSLSDFQPLYVQGGRGKGFNIYIKNGTLYAGSQSGKLDWGKLSNQEDGSNGYWLSTDRVEAGTWHHVKLVLKNGEKKVKNGKLSLYLDGDKIGTGPGARIPDHHAAPRVGRVRNTTLKSGKQMSDRSFHGRITDFHQVNRAVPPVSEAEQEKEEKEGKHLFILSGQSNMVGMDPSESFTPTVQDEFGADNVIVVKDAKGAQSILRWYKEFRTPDGRHPNASGDLYERLMNKVEKATKGKNLQTVSVIWMQGERDANEGWGEVYARSLNGLMDQFRTDFGRKDINFVIGRISDYDMDNSHHQDWTEVRQALVEVANAEPNADWVNTDDLNGKGDKLHYTEAGYKKLGRRFARKAIELIKNGSSQVDGADTR